jgi:PPM family protein phosphatase
MQPFCHPAAEGGPVTALRWGATTDVGNIRTNNEDHLLVAEPLFAVADGMGGHVYGEVASEAAVEALRIAFTNTAAGLVEAVKRANRAVYDKARADPALRGMGTTLCAVALVQEDGEDRLAIVNVGDSRVYLLRDGELEQLTTDHRLLEQLMQEGQLSAEEAAIHPQRNVLTRAMGLDPDVDVDCWQLDPFKGDRLLLCSDGLSGEVDDSQIASVLRRLADPNDAVKELVRVAKSAGGHDNITVIVLDVIDDDDRVGRANETLSRDGTGPVGDARPRTAVVEHGDDEGGGGAHSSPPTKPPKLKGQRASFLTARVVVFIVLLLIVVGGAVAAIGWYARGAYYVGLKGQQVAIYQGRPGGLLWFQPTLAQRTDVTKDQLTGDFLTAVKDGKEEPSLKAARAYVARLKPAVTPPPPAPSP